MENKAVAVMGYSDRVNIYRLNTNRTSSIDLNNYKTREEQ